MGQILVGIDGSPAAEAAVGWALDHCDADDTVTLFHAWSLPATIGFEGPAFGFADVESGANQLVADMAKDLATTEGPAIQTEVTYGHPGSTLIEKSAGFDLVVVGSRGYGGFRGLMLGSVSTYVVHHATCPVVVVPAPEK